MQKQKAQKIYLLLDFDGVLADSWELMVKLLQNEMQQFKSISPDSVGLRNASTREIFKKFNISLYRQWKLVRNIKSGISKKMDQIPHFEEFSQVCNSVKKQYGINIAIITSNSNENVSAFLRHQNIEFVDQVSGHSSLFGKHRSILKFIKKHHLDPDKVLYIGDEVRDIEGARKAGVRSLAVSWGFDGKTRLKDACPDFLAETAGDAKKIMVTFIQNCGM